MKDFPSIISISKYLDGIRRQNRHKIRYSEEDKAELIEALKNIMSISSSKCIEIYDFPDDMMQDRAGYAIEMILTAIKEQLVRGSFDILHSGKSKLKGSKLDKAIVDEMDQYFCDADNAVSWYYLFEIMHKKKLKQFTRMTPYVVKFEETTTDFYTNFRNSVIAQVAPSIKKEGKLKDKDKVKGKICK